MLIGWQATGDSRAEEGLVHFCCLCWVLEAVGRSPVQGQRWALPLVAMASGSRLALEAREVGGDRSSRSMFRANWITQGGRRKNKTHQDLSAW